MAQMFGFPGFLVSVNVEEYFKALAAWNLFDEQLWISLLRYEVRIRVRLR